MTHLTEGEIVDLIDGALASARAAHLDVCGSCRVTVDGLREVADRTAEAKIPEPSPLFWEHFSARVRAQVRSADVVEPVRWFGWADGSTARWAMAGALLTILLVSGVWLSVWRATVPAPGHVPPATMVTTAQPEPGVEPGADTFDADADEAWALVRTVADDLSWDEAAAGGLGVRPGSAEGALATLTRDERSELVRLLKAETKRPGA